MIGTVDLTVTVHTGSIERSNTKAGYSLVAGQEIHVALLTQLMSASGEQHGIIRAVLRMTDKTVFLNWRMLI